MSERSETVFEHGGVRARLQPNGKILLDRRGDATMELLEVEAHDIRQVLGRALDAIEGQHQARLAAARPEPPPVKNDQPSCWELVIRDMHAQGMLSEPDGRIRFVASKAQMIYNVTLQNLERLKALTLIDSGAPTTDFDELRHQIIEDMQARHEFGVRKYGTMLQPHNGRNALVDAYQEALDLAVYLRQHLYERDGR